MNKDKLMQIVQAVNDSRTEPVDIENNRHKLIARVIDHKDYTSGDIHSVNDSATFKSWQYICTVEEFNQCVKEMSAGYGKKESVMNNKHPHHDLIAEWNENNNTVFQMKPPSEYMGWQECNIHALIQHPNFAARVKPREFANGHWYPCFYNDGSVYIKIYNEGKFYSSGDCSSISFSEGEFSNIGKSLGEIDLN